MHTFTGPEFTPIYKELIESIISLGELEAKTRDLTNVNLTLEDPTQSLLLYKKNWKWAILELFDRMSPLYTDDRTRWNPGTAVKHRHAWKRKLKKEGGVFDYSYGDHYKDQVNAVIDLLSSKKTDREGIITVWDSKYLLQRDSFQRRPCTLHLHFFRRDGRLNLNLSMRSNDSINLFPYDVFHHTFLQRYIAAKLEIELGYYSHTVSHIYYPKRRESKGRQYFEKLFDGLEKNSMENEGYSKLGPFEDIDHDFKLFYSSEKDPSKYRTELISNMVGYLMKQKQAEFRFV